MRKKIDYQVSNVETDYYPCLTIELFANMYNLLSRVLCSVKTSNTISKSMKEVIFKKMTKHTFCKSGELPIFNREGIMKFVSIKTRS